MDLKTLLDAHEDIHRRVGPHVPPEGPERDEVTKDLRKHLHLFIQEVGVHGIATLIHILDEAVVQLYQGSTANPKHQAPVLNDLGMHYEVSKDELDDLMHHSSSFVQDCDAYYPTWMVEVLAPDVLRMLSNLQVSTAAQDSPEDEELIDKIDAASDEELGFDPDDDEAA